MIYTIKQGSHYPTPMGFSLHTGITNESKLVRFDPNCYFHTGTQDDNDWNKTWGFTQDIFGRNSLRVAWRPLKNSTTQVQLGAYIHKDGVRFTFPNWNLGSYNWNEVISITISHDGKVATFSATSKGITTTQSIPFEVCTCMGYRQYPYFGGNMTALHDMQIEII